MDKKYEENAKLFKVLSDENRIRIIEMISCDEICACNILEKLDITQPTLSHHMKVLEEVNLVSSRKDGTWTYYKLNRNKISKILMFIIQITSDNEKCICKE
ncbi:MAG: transcriptional regulator, ArsR family [Clostridia bacterium]|nr:transcriptional regulator, ArsR family [Clostridia bacterium]